MSTTTTNSSHAAVGGTLPFPLDIFPPKVATFCAEVARATGTPPDYAALAILVVAGAAIGNSRALCIKANTWYEAARFYAVMVGDPASGKNTRHGRRRSIVPNLSTSPAVLARRDKREHQWAADKEIAAAAGEAAGQ